MDMNDVLARAGKHSRGEIEVDVSGQCEPALVEGSFVITLREPTVDLVYAALGDVQRMKKRYPLWASDKLANILMLSQCHSRVTMRNGDEEPVTVGAAGPDAVEFYAAVGEQNDPLLMRVTVAMNMAWPWMQGLFPEAEKRQGESKASAPTSSGSASTTSTGTRQRSKSR